MMYHNRISKIQEHLSSCEAAIVSSRANMLYLSGMDSEDAIIIITDNDAFYLTDFRYIEKANSSVDSCQVRQTNYSPKDIYELLYENKITSVYLETKHTSIDKYSRYSAAFCEIEIKASDMLDNLLKDLRSVKNEAELSNIEEAQKMTDDTFSYILDRIRPGRTEKEVMLDMEFYMRGLGSEGVSFDFIVISGKNTSMPHGVPTDKPIEKGDLVTMDFGAVYKGYHSDMTRTVMIGKPSEDQKKIYDITLQAQLAALEFAGPGIICKDVDKISRDIINNAGYEGCFGHGLGHGVGLEIHEDPAFNTRCEAVTEKGMVITVEPGIYINGKFGCRIEDMICITEKGIKNLTRSSKELILL